MGAVAILPSCLHTCGTTFKVQGVLLHWTNAISMEQARAGMSG